MSSETFSKTYTVDKAEVGDAQYVLERNTNDLRQSAMSQGYKVIGDVTIEKQAQHGLRTLVVTLAAPVEVRLGADSGQLGGKVSPLDQVILDAAVKADLDPDAVETRVARDNQTPAQAVKAQKAGEVARPVRTSVAEQKIEKHSGLANALAEAEGEGDEQGADGDPELADPAAGGDQGDPQDLNPGERQGPGPVDDPGAQAEIQADAKVAQPEDTTPDAPKKPATRAKATDKVDGDK